VKIRPVSAALVLVVFVLAACGGPSGGDREPPASGPAKTADATDRGSAPAADAGALTTEAQQVSYSMGVRMGKGIEESGMAFDLDLLLQGIQDVLDGKEPAMTEDGMRDATRKFHQAATARQRDRRQESGDKNRAESEAFLAENANKEGVVVLASGLQYQILEEGSGEHPQPTDEVRAHYRGTLVNGEQFDSSHDRGQPSQFSLQRVIAGWKEALPMMKEGGKWRMFVPSDLAYGEKGAGKNIGPHAALVFEVELIEIVDQQEAAPADDANAKEEAAQ